MFYSTYIYSILICRILSRLVGLVRTQNQTDRQLTIHIAAHRGAPSCVSRTSKSNKTWILRTFYSELRMSLSATSCLITSAAALWCESSDPGVCLSGCMSFVCARMLAHYVYAFCTAILGLFDTIRALSTRHWVSFGKVAYYVYDLIVPASLMRQLLIGTEPNPQT
jgi:hypothetical protein